MVQLVKLNSAKKAKSNFVQFIFWKLILANIQILYFLAQTEAASFFCPLAKGQKKIERMAGTDITDKS